MKHISKILYCVGIPLFTTAILLTAIAIPCDLTGLRITGIVLAFISGGTIGLAFFFDFKNTMIEKETAGDMFSHKAKIDLIKILDEAGVEYEEDKGREYYLYMVREHVVTVNETKEKTKEDK